MEFNLPSPELEASALHHKAIAALACRDYASATQAGIGALIAAVKTHSPNSEPVAMILCTLGAALSSDWPRLAECLLNAAVALDTGRNQPGDDASAALQSNLSAVYKATGRYELAVTAAEKCVRIRQHALETPPEKLALAIHNLGAAHLAAGNSQAAEESLRKALDLRSRLQLPKRAATASFLVSSLLANARDAIQFGEAFLLSANEDKWITSIELAEVHMSLADAWLACHRKSKALAALTQAHWLASNEDEELSKEIQGRLQYVSDRRNWSLLHRFRGWNAAKRVGDEEKDWAWYLFHEVSDHSRFFMSKALTAVASPSTRAFCGMAKRLDVATQGPFEQIDPGVLQTRLGPPTDKSDNVFIYVAADGRFMANWVPSCRINPLFVAFLNGIVAMTAYALMDKNSLVDAGHSVKSWIDALRSLVREAGPAQAASVQPTSDRTEKGNGEINEAIIPTRPTAQAISYFPRLIDFEIRERQVEGTLVFSWLHKIRSADTVGYEALLWIERASEVPIRFGSTGGAVGAPVLVVALERSHDFGDYFFCAFTIDGHMNFGKRSPESAEIWPLFCSEARDLSKSLLAEISGRP